jgi:hypothetical protein
MALMVLALATLLNLCSCGEDGKVEHAEQTCEAFVARLRRDLIFESDGIASARMGIANAKLVLEEAHECGVNLLCLYQDDCHRDIRLAVAYLLVLDSSEAT